MNLLFTPSKKSIVITSLILLVLVLVTGLLQIALIVSDAAGEVEIFPWPGNDSCFLNLSFLDPTGFVDALLDDIFPRPYPPHLDFICSTIVPPAEYIFFPFYYLFVDLSIITLLFVLSQLLHQKKMIAVRTYRFLIKFFLLLLGYLLLIPPMLFLLYIVLAGFGFY